MSEELDKITCEEYYSEEEVENITGIHRNKCPACSVPKPLGHADDCPLKEDMNEAVS